jgi:polysaccharide pyruvyl transferase WcaK-like protein
MKKNVALIGWNGMKNVGDDAMTFVIVDRLSKVRNFKKLLLLSDNDPSALQFVNTFKDQLQVKFPFLYKMLIRIPIIGGFYYRWVLSVYIILFYDLVIIGGGTLYHSKGLNAFFVNLIKIKKLFRKSVDLVSIGVSIGPFKDVESADLFLQIKNGFDFIAVRDNRSYEYCLSISNSKECIYAPDIALALPTIKPIYVEKKREIGIILRQGHITSDIQNLILKTIKGTLDKYPDLRIVFHCFCELDNKDENDYLGYLDLKKEIPSVYLERVDVNRYNSNPDHFYNSLGSSIINLCMRLHGSIISYSMNTPFIMLSYHQKCTDFFNDMNIDRGYLIDNYSNLDKVLELIDKAYEGTVTINSTKNLESLNHFSFLEKYK